MNPQLIWMLAAQRQDEVRARAARGGEIASAMAERRAARRRALGWRLNWTRSTLAPACDGAGRAGRSWVIIISATRSA